MITNLKEKLLMQYMDGELSFWLKPLATLLIKKDAKSAKYIESLTRCSSSLKQQLSQQTSTLNQIGLNPELSANIFARIQQEEHAQVFLGKRELEQVSVWQKFNNSLFSLPSAGLATAALLAFVFFGSSNSNKLGTTESNLKTASTINDQTQIENVSLTQSTTAEIESNSSSYVAPRILKDRQVMPIEVDWMRSSGRVSVMPSNGNQSAIIWVKKPRSEVQNSRQLNSRLQK